MRIYAINRTIADLRNLIRAFDLVLKATHFGVDSCAFYVLIVFQNEAAHSQFRVDHSLSLVVRDMFAVVYWDGTTARIVSSIHRRLDYSCAYRAQFNIGPSLVAVLDSAMLDVKDRIGPMSAFQHDTFVIGVVAENFIAGQ